MHLMFSLLIFVLSFFCVESPRWLVKVSRDEAAVQNLAKIRGLPPTHELVEAEIADIKAQLAREQEATSGSTFTGVIKELFTLPANRYRIMLSIMSQFLSQWSGASSITIYAVQYFAMMGTTGQNEKLFATAIFGLVKFCSAMICALFLVDFIGMFHPCSFPYFTFLFLLQWPPKLFDKANKSQAANAPSCPASPSN